MLPHPTPDPTVDAIIELPGDRIVLMRDGAIVQQGGVTDLLEHPADPFVTEFIRAQRSELPL